MHTKNNTDGCNPQKCKIILGTMKITLQMVSVFNTYDYIRKGIKYYLVAHSCTHQYLFSPSQIRISKNSEEYYLGVEKISH